MGAPVGHARTSQPQPLGLQGFVVTIRDLTQVGVVSIFRTKRLAERLLLTE